MSCKIKSDWKSTLVAYTSIALALMCAGAAADTSNNAQNQADKTMAALWGAAAATLAVSGLEIRAESVRDKIRRARDTNNRTPAKSAEELHRCQEFQRLIQRDIDRNTRKR